MFIGDLEAASNVPSGAADTVSCYFFFIYFWMLLLVVPIIIIIRYLLIDWLRAEIICRQNSLNFPHLLRA